MSLIEITPWHWIGFIFCVLFFLALDLGVFHRRARVVKFKEALAWSAVWVALSLLFAAALNHWRGREEAVEFVTGYVIEFSLSLDNIFVIALLFAYFRVPEESRHRLLFWGILGALVMRGAMIALGVTLIQSYSWILYVLGVFLVFTGGRMLFAGNAKEQPENNIAIRLARRIFPGATHAAGQNQTVAEGGINRFAPAPLLLVLALVEITDLIFPGGFFHHAQCLHRFHVKCPCHSGPPLAVFCARRRHQLFPPFENRPLCRAGLRRRENAARFARA
jgi:tellurite resistance protein TerC